MQGDVKKELDPKIIALFQQKLIEWYQTFQRRLPWRETTDPYAILVSEIMLHQTTVRQVISVYQRFLERFPSLKTLATADLKQVKAITDALGYRQRGKYLWTIAKSILNDYGGQVPDSVEILQKLPGIGRYTAGAIVSFAFRKPAPIVDTNVERILKRVFNVPQEGSSTAFEKKIWAIAERLVPQDPDRVYDFNQGIMDLGAMVCIPDRPRCGRCPLRKICQYYQQLPNPPPRQRLLQEFNEPN